MYDEINIVVLMPMDADQKCELLKAMPFRWIISNG